MEPSVTGRTPDRKNGLVIIICGVMMVVFAITSFSAATTKNATIDEPAHALSGWLEIRHGDFRLDPPNPALWKCWAALGNLFSNPRLDGSPSVLDRPTWDANTELAWASQVLYCTPDNDGDSFVNRSRFMMMIVAVVLGLVTIALSNRLAGPVAAVTTSVFFCLDPNLLAQASLLKSDISLALMLILLSWSVLNLGHHATIWRVVGVALICGAAVNVKFSGAIIMPILAVMLAFRALSPVPWDVGRRNVSTRLGRLIMVFFICVKACLVMFFMTWACYGLRFRPAPPPQAKFNMADVYDRGRLIETTVELGHHASSAEITARAPSLVLRAVQWADQHHLLPQSALFGFLYARDCTLAWAAFLDGELYGDGRWSYFPLAMVYKAPVATLLAVVLAMIVGVTAIFRNPKSAPMGRPLRGEMGWTVACFVIPFAIFAMASLQAHLNIGVRSVLPLYPFIYIGVGCAAAWAWARRPRLTVVIVAVLGVALAAETLSAWPDFIAFFNVAVGGESGGIRHLSDSNLDWGQDVKSLARWQRDHPPVPLFTDYDGGIDPHFYGLKYHPLWIDANGLPESDVPLVPGLLAIRATHLQGLYIKPSAVPFYNWLRSQPPIVVIGGTIYIYKFLPADFDRAMRVGG